MYNNQTLTHINALYNTKVCYSWLHSAPRVKREACILPILVVGTFRPTFLRERGHPLQNVNTVW